jgi:hypothetical protein
MADVNEEMELGERRGRSEDLGDIPKREEDHDSFANSRSDVSAEKPVTLR